MGEEETPMKTWGRASVGLAVVLSVASSVQSDEPSSVTPVESKGIRIPVTVASTHRVIFESLNLFVSTDRGKTWKLAETIGLDKPAFYYSPAEPGTYWFAVQTVRKGGRKCPESIGDLGPTIAATVEEGGPPELTIPSAEYLHDDVEYLPPPPQIDDQSKQQDDSKAKPVEPSSIKVPEYYTGGDDFWSLPPSAWAEMSVRAGPRAPAPGRYQVAFGGNSNTLIVLTDTATGRCWVRSLVFDDEGWRDLKSPAPAGR
jgi:hypothetical protein